MKKDNMQDVQSGPAEVSVPVDRVGVRGITLPIVVRDKSQGRQHTVAKADLGVELPAAFKGTHMSRFVEALENFKEELDYNSLKELLQDIKNRLEAPRAYVLFAFPYFMRKVAPVSRSLGLIHYDCRLTGELADNKPSFLLQVKVPVMTVCPCSKAISDEGAHSQRAIVSISVRLTDFIWIEDFVAIAESSASSPVYTLLKREDEKFVTEYAFAHPTFVEDVARNVADKLSKCQHIAWYCVEVESEESIHAHNAFARIESPQTRA